MDAGFWDDVHSRSDIEWLGFSIPHEVLTLHRLSPENQRVADIGVGNGEMAAVLMEKGNTVVAIDISPVAIERTVAGEKVLVDDIASIKPVDLGICHLVFQHCQPEQCVKILSLPLTRKGMLSVQYAEFTSPDVWVADREAGRLVDHPYREMVAMAQKAGKRIVDSRHVATYDTINWHVAQVVNAR